MGLGEELSKARLRAWRPVQSSSEALPLLVSQDESCLVREGPFGFFTSGASDEVGDVEAPPLGRDLDKRFLAGGSAELKSPVSGLFGPTSA